MSATTHRIFASDGSIFINCGDAAHFLGVDRSQVRSIQYREDCIEKMKNPWDGRKVAYKLNDILRLADRASKDPDLLSDRQKPSKEDPTVKRIVEAVAGREDEAWALEIVATCVADKDVEGSIQPSDKDVEGSIQTTPQVKQKEGLMEILVIGEDVAYVRKDVEQIVARSEDLAEETLVFEIDYVKNRCFGYADETNDECSKHCNIISACAEKRNEMLRQIGERLDKRDADRRKLADMSANIQKIDEIRNKTLDDWGS